MSAKKVAGRPQSMVDMPMHYCPGCTHGITHRLVAEALDELGVTDRTIGVGSVGCSVYTYKYFDCDMHQGSHGRGPAVATGIKRVVEDAVVFTYQGDGDLAAIGTTEIVHAAARGEKITVLFINNAIYGMTGGQMAPTTLVGQVTNTSPKGRDASINGYPIKMSEMLAVLEGSAYIARVSTHKPSEVMKAKKAIKKAFEIQLEGLGFTMVEVLSTCPTGWGVSPVESLKWIQNRMLPYFPLGEFKDVRAGVK